MARLSFQKRDHLVLMAGSAAIVVLLVYLLAEGPLKAYRGSADELAEAREHYDQARLIHDEVVRSRQSEKILATWLRERGSFNLFSFVNSALQRAGLSDRDPKLESRRGVTALESLAAVELTLEGVSMEELVKVLHLVYSSDNLIVLHSLEYLRPTREGKGLECQMTFVSPKE